MKVTFIGATHEVTGSCTYLNVAGHKYLVDCGMEQGKDIFVNQDIPVPAKDIEAVFLTHAHIDHSGNLPLLYKNGFRGKVYATEATTNLCQIMLLDSAGIQEAEAEWKNRKGRRAGQPDYVPLYTSEDAQAVLRSFIPLSYGSRIRVSECLELRFNDAGHLLGAASAELWLTEDGQTRKLVFSGDIGNSDRPLIHDPRPVDAADYVVIESTYGNRLHESHAGNHTYINQLATVLDRTFARGGNVVIPSFAVGRTQELLYFIREIKAKGMVKSQPNFKVYIDSPLAVEATAVFMQTPRDFFNEETQEVLASGRNPIGFPGLEVSVSTQESIAINFDPTPKVIISASGMCEAGRIRHHLKHNLWRSECTILFVGYQTVGSLGRILQEGAASVRLFNEEIAVKAEMAVMDGISGHADRNGLTSWLTAIPEKPQLVFVNHGEDASVKDFAAYLSETFGYSTAAPYSGTCYDLLTGECVENTEGIPITRAETPEQQRNNDIFAALQAAQKQITALVGGMKTHSNKEIKSLTADLEKLIGKYTKEN